MAEMTYETLELMLCGSDETILKGFARKLGFDVETAAGLTRRKLLKGIRDFINETLDNGREEENVTRLTDWLHFFGRGEDQTGEENTEVDGNRRNESMEQEPGVGNGTQDPGPQENRDFDKSNFPSKQIRKIEELLQTEDEVRLYAANGTAIPYGGFIELKLELISDSSSNKSVIVPFLVTTGALDLPIIGFNVICELTKNKDGIIKATDKSVIDQIQASFPALRSDHDSQAFISLVKDSVEQDYVCSVKTTKKDIIVPKQTTISIPCRGNSEFIPNQMPALSVPNVTDNVPEGLKLDETVVC